MAEVSNSKLFQTKEDIRDLQDVLVVLIKTEWNSRIVDELEQGCLKVLKDHRIRTSSLVVPGAVEIPFAIQQSWHHSQEARAYIALGCVIRGGTPHFEYVCQSVTQGITQLNLTLPVPVIFGVLTVDTTGQAEERIGGSHGHKGEEAAITAIKMMLVQKQLKEKAR